MALGSSRVVDFERERDRRSAEVFAAHPSLLLDHRREHSWLTGALGNPFSDVWFVAENPSLTQMERVTALTPESQWLQSNGDKLFRQMLVEHGFKDSRAEEIGGWRCYITDAVKSADRAGLWARRPAAERHAIVDAWAPVLRWELAQHRPLLIVAVGKPADRYLTRLERSGALARLPERRRIPHYSYVAMRPDKWGRRAGHPERIEEYRALFAEIATRACELRAPT